MNTHVPQELITYCQNSIKKGSKSFSLASCFFNNRQKIGSWLLYSWCRYADDLIDKAENKAEALERLNALESKTRLCFQTPRTEILSSTELDAPELKGLALIAADFNIPSKYALDLLRGMRMDIENRKYENLDELLDYCYCVAGTVGLMMCHIMGLSNPLALENAVRMGNAMQLTNISRDVLEDWEMGRIYFPRQWLRELDLDESNFGQAEIRPLWFKLTKKLLAVADENYRSGWMGLQALPFRAAWAVAIAARVYSRIGAKVLKARERAWDKRRYVMLPEKILIALSTTFQISILMLPRLLNPWRESKINLTWGEK